MLFLAALVHGILIIGITFNPELTNPFADAISLEVTIVADPDQQIDRPDGTQARLEIDAIIRGADDRRFEDPVIARTFSATVPASGSDPDAIANALTLCAETVASEIAAAWAASSSRTKPGTVPS